MSLETMLDLLLVASAILFAMAGFLAYFIATEYDQCE